MRSSYLYAVPVSERTCSLDEIRPTSMRKVSKKRGGYYEITCVAGHTEKPKNEGIRSAIASINSIECFWRFEILKLHTIEIKLSSYR